MVSIITTVVAHIDHGKTTLIDCLVAAHGKISKSLAGDMRFMDTREDEQSRGITLKMSAISVMNNNTTHTIIDTPGHVDFEFLIEQSSLLSDCFLIIIDLKEGITPRTHSLIKYINKHMTILVINKIDKVPENTTFLILDIINLINEMIGEMIFTWENNNIILCSAILCYGVNYQISKKIFRKNTTIEHIVKCINYIEKQIFYFENKKPNEIDKLCKKFFVANKTRKSILSSIMSLSDSIFNSLETIYKYDQKEYIAYVSLGLIKNEYKKEDLLFITRLHYGILKIGTVLYSHECEHKIKEIYKYTLNGLEKIDEISGSNLICIKSNVKKNTFLSNKPHNLLFKEVMYPFYRSFFKYNDFMKEALSAIVNTEQCLKLKIDKFNQLSVMSSGKVQVEKMLEDLKKCGIYLEYVENDFIFCESVREKYKEIFEGNLSICIYPNTNNIDEDNESNFFEFFKCKYGESSKNELILNVNSRNKNSKNNDVYLKNKSKFVNQQKLILDNNLSNIQKHENNRRGNMNIEDQIESISLHKVYKDEFNNIFKIKSKKWYDLIISILEIFTLSGPIINENIRDTTFEVTFDEYNLTTDQVYYFIKDKINHVYHKSSPQISPFFYHVKISTKYEYLGKIYTLLQKNKCFLKGEEYEQNTGFYILYSLVPHFNYDLLVENIRIHTKGTSYMSSTEYGFFHLLDFSEYIYKLRKLKGLQTDEKIIDNPEKQRTLKK